MNTYALPKDSQAWQNALNNIEHLLPEDTAKSIQSLKQLPVFGIVLVIHAEALADLINSGQSVDGVVQAWVDAQRGWQVVPVADDDEAISQAYRVETHENLDDVSIFRYLLVPTDNKQMTPSKREAVAHVIDEQLTTYLKKTLKPTPKYDFEIDSNGFVSELSQEQLNKIAKRQHLDVHILSISQMLRKHKLVCFDMDSTLIHQEVIIELARVCGVEEQVAEITESAMRGEIDFSESFIKRVALLKCMNASVIEDIIKERITFSEGAFATIKALKANGCHTVLISGGFIPFAQYVAKTLGMDEYYANPLTEVDGQLTGDTDPNNIIDGKAKARIVARIADEMSIDMEEVICVGDGANDLPMMNISDIGIAYKAKPIVRVKADTSINITGLEGVLYAMGHMFFKVSE